MHGLTNPNPGYNYHKIISKLNLVYNYTKAQLVSSLNRPQPGCIDKPLSIFLHQKRLLRHPVGLRDVGDHLWGIDFGQLRGAPDADVDRVVVGGVPDVDFAELTFHMICNKTYITSIYACTVFSYHNSKKRKR